MNCQHIAVESPLLQGFAEFSVVGKLGMNWRCEERGGWWTCTASPRFVRGRRYEGCSEMLGREWYGLSGGEKNSVWSLRSGFAPNLRSQAALGARPLGGRRQNLPGDREPSGALSELREGEAGEAGMALRQPFLHQALCLLRRPALSNLDDQGHCPRTVSGLEDGQGSRQGVYAGAAPKSGNAGSAGDRYRRGLDPKGAHASS